MAIQLETRSVTVIHGPNDGIFDLAGITVAVVQRTLMDAFNLRSNAIAFVNGEEVESKFKLSAGDRLEFIYRQGTKGLGDLLTPEELMGKWHISPDEYQELQQLGLPTVPFNNGTVRHPEVAVDDWWKSIVTPNFLIRTEVKHVSRSWLNPPASDPPPTHRFGPLTGTQEQLASWLHPKGKPDPRHLKARAEKGVVWVRAVHSRLNEVWFKTQREVEVATSRRNETLPKLPEPAWTCTKSREAP